MQVTINYAKHLSGIDHAFNFLKPFSGLAGLALVDQLRVSYFRKTFVEKLNWLSDEEYGQIVALSQFLPGQVQAKVGFAI